MAICWGRAGAAGLMGSCPPHAPSTGYRCVALPWCGTCGPQRGGSGAGIRKSCGVQGKEPQSPLQPLAPRPALCTSPCGVAASLVRTWVQLEASPVVSATWKTLLCRGRQGEAAGGWPHRDTVPALGLCVGKCRCTADGAPAGSQVGVSRGCSQNRHIAAAWHSPASSISTNSAVAGQRGLLQER